MASTNILDEYTKIIDLPIGTKFYVINGMWYGEVVLKNGRKYVNHSKGGFYIRENDSKHIKIL